MNNQISLEALNGLSEAEKQLALKILKEYAENGQSELFEEMQQLDFDEVPVDIHTFLHDRNYLGNALYDAEGRFTLFPYWEKCLEDTFPDNVTTKYNTIVLTGAIGLGKAQPLDSQVLTETGFKKMRDLQLTDKIYGNDGKLHNLIGIFPQGKKKICRVTFTDNTSTLCCDEHLWTVYNTKNKKWTTLETKELISGKRNLKHAFGHRYKIPMTKPIEFAEKELVIDPYIFGVLLGNGHIVNNVTFSGEEQEVVDNVAIRLKDGYEIHKLQGKLTYSICKKDHATTYSGSAKTQIPTSNIYFETIKKYNLNTTAPHKYIPTDYLYNSVTNRIALLQGLMDTDGFISKDGALIEFTTISEQLRDNFVWLVQSLGGTCHVRTKHPSYKNKSGEVIQGQTTYCIGIKLPKSICPFKLTRKRSRISNRALEPFRYIKSIEYVGEDECQCIYIDSEEHLYLTNDFIVTHNTLVAVVMLLYMLYRLLCLKDPYQYYGMQPIDKLTISLMNMTIGNARGVALDKMNQMILASPWFMSHGEMAGTSNLIYRPEKHIEIIVASGNNQVIGRAIFCLDGQTKIETSEGVFTLEELKDKQIKVVSIDEAGNKVLSDFCTVQPTVITDEEYQIELEDGTVVKCTGNHRLMLKDGTYKEAQLLTENDEIMDICTR